MTSEPPSGTPGPGRHRAGQPADPAVPPDQVTANPAVPPDQVTANPPVPADGPGLRPAPDTGDLPVLQIPEGAAPLYPPLIVRRLVFIAVLGVTAVSVPVTVLGGFRAGGSVLASALLLSSLARAVLPAEYCLGLLVRSRRVDVVTSLVLAVAVGVCAWIVPVP